MAGIGIGLRSSILYDVYLRLRLHVYVFYTDRFKNGTRVVAMGALKLFL